MKFVIAMMQHETNTFSPLPTDFENFAGATGFKEPPRGEAAIAAYGGKGWAFGAFLDLAREAGAEVSVPLAANAEPSGKVRDQTFDQMAEIICAAVAKGCDGVMLDLHGAMVCDGHDDGEGELLRRLRQIAPDVPIGVALDFHTNLTADMVDNATVITGYRTYPHVDMYETGIRAGRCLLSAFAGNARPRMVWGALPMLTHMIKQTPAAQPMKDIMDKAIAAEAAGEILNASVFGGFPLADIPHASLSAVVTANDHSQRAQALLDELLDLAWSRRADFVFDAEPLADSITRAKKLDRDLPGNGPIVLADHGDNAGAGGNCDSMAATAEALRQGLENLAVGPIWDPEAVDALYKAGLGAKVTLHIGGKTAAPAVGLSARPLTLSGRVKALTDGRFKITGPMMTGFEVNLGRTAVLDCGPAEILVSESRCEAYDQGYFTHAGINPMEKRFILLKSRQHFRAGFEDVAKAIVLVAGPGVCSSDYKKFKFEKVKRPIYPLDLQTQRLIR